MGRIKSALIKRTAEQILAGPDAADFNEDFNHNKKLLGKTMPDKSVRNKVAGYMVTLKRQQSKPRVVKPKVEEEVEQSM